MRRGVDFGGGTYHRLITLEDIDECISQFLPKLFYTIEEDKDRNIVIYVPDYATKSIFHELDWRMSTSIPFKVLPTSEKKEN